MELLVILAIGLFIWRIIAFIGQVDTDIETGAEEIRKFGKEFLNGNSLEDYQRKHPNCFNGAKFKGCHNCGEKSVWVKEVGNTEYGIHHQHLCRHCGESLWRSNL